MYWVVSCTIKGGYEKDGDHNRWARGEVGATYLLGIYSKIAEAYRVHCMLKVTSPCLKGWVAINLCSMTRAQVYKHESMRYTNWSEIRPNRFYPEAMCNGFSEALPPVKTDDLASFLRLRRGKEPIRLRRKH